MADRNKASLVAQQVQRWWPRITLIALILLGIYIIFGREGGIIRVLELKSENDQLNTEISRLQSEKAELEQQIQLLEEKDATVIEEEARRMGMQKPGETVLRIQYETVDDSADVMQKD